MADQKKAASASKAQPLIHPLFAKSRFPKNVRWIKAFHKSAILATRLLDSPQVQNFVYAFLFVVNKATTLPEKVKEEGDPDSVPFEFACDKAIDQLSKKDIAAVRQHLVELAPYVRYEIGTEDESKWAGEAERVARSSADVPYDSCVIRISTHKYHAALYRREERTPRDAAVIEFVLAALMLHEVAHALHIVFMGPRHRMEDFFEDSLVAELGHEFESRLFGLCPSVSTHGPRDKSYWVEWQTRDFMVDAHDDLREIVRDLPELPEGMRMLDFKSGFAVKLADDEFWEEWAEESTRMRARLLLPRCVVDICFSDDTSGIPQSIADLFRSWNSKSYAEEYYSDLANPDRIPRNAAFLTRKSGDDQEKDYQVHRSHHQGDGQGDGQEYEYGDYHEYDYGDSQDYSENDQEDFQDYDQEFYEEKDQEDYPEDFSDDDQNDSESEDLWSEDDSDDSDSEDQESEDGQEDFDSEDEETDDEKKDDQSDSDHDTSDEDEDVEMTDCEE